MVKGKVATRVLVTQVVAILIVNANIPGAFDYSPSLQLGIAIKGHNVVAHDGIVIAARAPARIAGSISGTHQYPPAEIVHNCVIYNASICGGMPELNSKDTIVDDQILNDMAATIRLINALNRPVTGIAAEGIISAHIVNIVGNDVVIGRGKRITVNPRPAVRIAATGGRIVDVIFDRPLMTSAQTNAIAGRT